MWMLCTLMSKMCCLQVKEITSMYASNVSRWTAEALTALQEVCCIDLQKLIRDIFLVIPQYCVVFFPLMNFFPF